MFFISAAPLYKLVIIKTVWNLLNLIYLSLPSQTFRVYWVHIDALSPELINVLQRANYTACRKVAMGFGSSLRPANCILNMLMSEKVSAITDTDCGSSTSIIVQSICSDLMCSPGQEDYDQRANNTPRSKRESA